MAEILLVDDEPDIVMLTRMVLENEGHHVLVARDGRECMKVLADENPDLILLDVMMPGDDGWEVCRKIKADKKTRNTPVVMFTVRTSMESRKTSLDCADAQIDKPFMSEELLNVVNSFLNEEKTRIGEVT